MWIIQFISRIDNKSVCGTEGPFEDQDKAVDYLDQRDHMLDFDTKIFRLSPPRFEPDQSYLDAV
jgi:hypothetical protein